MKKMLVGFVGTMMISSLCLAAAPVTDLNKGETVVGYSFSNFEVYDIDLDTDGFYLEHGIADKFILGVDRNEIENALKITDIYAKYKLDNNVSLTAGNREYSALGLSESKFTYGIEGSTVLADKIVGYAALKHNNLETEWKLGATYALADQVNLDLNYASKDFDGTDEKIKGIGFGINYKF